MERLSTKQTLAMLGLTHRNSLRSRIASGELTPIVDRGRNYYDKAQVERLARSELIDGSSAWIKEMQRRAELAAKGLPY